jgi:hypothetical protein
MEGCKLRSEVLNELGPLNVLIPRSLWLNSVRGGIEEGGLRRERIDRVSCYVNNLVGSPPLIFLIEGIVCFCDPHAIAAIDLLPEKTLLLQMHCLE